MSHIPRHLSHTLSLWLCVSRFRFFFVEFNVGKYKIKIERERTEHTGVHIWRADRKKYKEKQTEDQQTRSHRVAVWRAQPFVFGQRQSRHERGGFDRIFSRFLNIAAASSTRTHTHTFGKCSHAVNVAQPHRHSLANKVLSACVRVCWWIVSAIVHCRDRSIAHSF